LFLKKSYVVCELERKKKLYIYIFVIMAIKPDAVVSFMQAIMHTI